MDLGLKGKFALVTGATKGVGQQVAQCLAEEGCNLVLVARTARNLEQVKSEITAAHDVTIETASADLSIPDQRSALAGRFPAVDIVISNTGATAIGSITEIDEARWREGWELKFYGYLALMRSFYPLMCERGAGVLLSVMGVSGERPDPDTLAVGMVNASLNAMSKAIGGTSSDHNVRVLGVNPGPILTERGIAKMRSIAAAKLRCEPLGGICPQHTVRALCRPGRNCLSHRLSGVWAGQLHDRNRGQCRRRRCDASKQLLTAALHAPR